MDRLKKRLKKKRTDQLVNIIDLHLTQIYCQHEHCIHENAHKYFWKHKQHGTQDNLSLYLFWTVKLW